MQNLNNIETQTFGNAGNSSQINQSINFKIDESRRSAIQMTLQSIDQKHLEVSNANNNTDKDKQLELPNAIPQPATNLPRIDAPSRMQASN